MALFQGINQGLRTSLAITGDIQNQQRQAKLDDERAEEKQYRRGLDGQAQARQAKQDDRQSAQDALTVAGQDEQAAQRLLLGAAGKGGLSQAERAEVDKRKGSANQLRDEARKKLGYENKAEEGRRVLDAIDAGAALHEIPGDKLGDAFSYTFGHPISDLIDRDGQPSPLGAALGATFSGIQSGDPESTLAGINFVLRPEIEQGVGTRLPNGDIITEKFVSNVSLAGGKGKATLTVRAKKPDGTEYDYDAPMTKGRAPGGELLEFDVNTAMDRLMKYGELLEYVNEPSRAPLIQQKAAEWEKGGAAEQWKALRSEYIAAGGEAKDFDALKGKVKTETKNRGGYDEDITTDEQGNVISTKRVDRTAAPEAPGIAAERKARADYYKQRGTGGLASAGKSGGTMLAVDQDGNEREWSPGDPLAEGEQVIRVPSKPIAGEPDRRKQAETILKELKTDYQAQVKANGALGAGETKAPTIEDAIAELDRRDAAFAPKPPPAPGKPPVQPLQDTRTAQPPLRAAGLQEGATAVNRQTGQRIQFRNGKWEPVQ